MRKEDLLELAQVVMSVYKQFHSESTDTVLPFGVVRCGEKVIALSNNDRANVGEPTVRGEIFTVARYNKGAYRFEERGSYYDPYLGEEATPWYGTKDFLPLNEESVAVVKDLDDIDRSYREMLQSSASHVIPCYVPKIKLTAFSKREDYESLIEEYRILISGLSKSADSWKKDEKLLKVLQSNTYLHGNDSFHVDYETPFKYASNRVVEDIHKSYDTIYSGKMNPIKKLAQRDKVNGLQKYVCDSFHRQIRLLSDYICEQYKLEILAQMKDKSNYNQ